MDKARKYQLLNGVANQLEDGQPAMGGEFLTEYGCSYDEAMELSDLLALVIRGFSNLPRPIQEQVLIASVGESPVEAEALLASLDQVRGMKECRKMLETIYDDE